MKTKIISISLRNNRPKNRYEILVNDKDYVHPFTYNDNIDSQDEARLMAKSVTLDCILQHQSKENNLIISHIVI